MPSFVPSLRRRGSFRSCRDSVSRFDNASEGWFLDDEVNVVPVELGVIVGDGRRLFGIVFYGGIGVEW